MTQTFAIQTGTEIKFENVASFRKRMKPHEIQPEVAGFIASLQQAGAVLNGPIISTTFGTEQLDGEALFDLEFLVPLKEKVELAAGQQFKPVFRIVNAVYTRYQGHPGMIEPVYGSMTDYMSKHRLQQITSAYNVTVNEGNPTQGIMPTIDIYIGVNPNSV